MESQLKPLRKITVSYKDPNATDSDSDVDGLRSSQQSQPKRKDIVILQDKLVSNPLPISRSGDETTKNDNPAQKIQRTHKLQDSFLSKSLGVKKGDDSEIKKSQKLQHGTSSKFPGVRKREWGKFAAEIRNPFDKKKMWLGSFDTEEEAVKAYQSKKEEFEMIIEKMNKKSKENNVNCLQRTPFSALNVTTFDVTNSKESVVNMANARLRGSSDQMKKPLQRIPEMDGKEKFDLKKFQDLMYSWYVEESLEVAAPVSIIKPVANELGAWQPNKKAKVCNDEYIPSSPPLSPILNFEQNMLVGNDLKGLGFEENFTPNCDREDALSELFELKPFPMFFPDQELDEQDLKQLSDGFLINDCQFSN